ncbi:hypothetical protein KEM52_003356, partial [Ascosphaera acerosa]
MLLPAASPQPQSHAGMPIPVSTANGASSADTERSSSGLAAAFQSCTFASPSSAAAVPATAATGSGIASASQSAAAAASAGSTSLTPDYATATTPLFSSALPVPPNATRQPAYAGSVASAFSPSSYSLSYNPHPSPIVSHKISDVRGATRRASLVSSVARGSSSTPGEPGSVSMDASDDEDYVSGQDIELDDDDDQHNQYQGAEGPHGTASWQHQHYPHQPHRARAHQHHAPVARTKPVSMPRASPAPLAVPGMLPVSSSSVSAGLNHATAMGTTAPTLAVPTLATTSSSLTSRSLGAASLISSSLRSIASPHDSRRRRNKTAARRRPPVPRKMDLGKSYEGLPAS